MNINARKEDIITNLNDTISMLKNQKNTAINEISKSISTLNKIVFSGKIEKDFSKYFITKIKYIIIHLNLAYLNLFNSNNKTLTTIYHMHNIENEINELSILNNITTMDYNHQITSEKAYLAYWIKKFSENYQEYRNLSKQIKNLENKKKELLNDDLSESTFFDLATLEEIDIYNKFRYQKKDKQKETKGLNKYLKKEGYLTNPKDIQNFISYLRNYLFKLITITPNVTDKNILKVYEIAYQETINVFQSEPLTKPSINKTLNYLILNDKIRYNPSDGRIINCTKIKEKYNKDLNNLFIHAFIEFVSYIDYDEIKNIYTKCCEVVSNNTHFYPQRPLSLNKTMHNALKSHIERIK